MYGAMVSDCGSVYVVCYVYIGGRVTLNRISLREKGGKMRVLLFCFSTIHDAASQKCTCSSSSPLLALISQMLPSTESRILHLDCLTIAGPL